MAKFKGYVTDDELLNEIAEAMDLLLRKLDELENWEITVLSDPLLHARQRLLEKMSSQQ